MKLVIQRVTAAKVVNTLTKKTVGQIDKGLFILLGVGKTDTTRDAELMAEKVCKLRIMSDTQEKMNLSVADAKAQILVVSQFTLYADTSKGNRPSFIKAGEPALAEEIYEHFVEYLTSLGASVQTGVLGLI